MQCKVLAGIFAVAAVASAQQITFMSYAVDAASYTRGIAPGSVFIVSGLFPLPAGLHVSALPLERSLQGVSLTLTPQQAGDPVQTWMLYTSFDPRTGASQVAAVLPSSTPRGNYSIHLTSGAAGVMGGPMRVVGRKYRSLANNQQGYGLAVIQNYVSPGRVDRNMFVSGVLPDGQTKSPARPSQTVILWGLGLGAIPLPDNMAPGPFDLRGIADVRIAVGGVPANVLYAGRSPEFPGIDQINFTIPPNSPAGCNVALQVTVDGEASNPVTIAIAPPGKDACEHPRLSREQLDSLDHGGSFMTGEFHLMRYVEDAPVDYGPRFVEIHSSIGYFALMTASRASTLNHRSVPPGQCTLFRGDGMWGALDVGAEDSALGGRLTVSGPGLPDVPLDGEDDWYFRLFSARLEGSGESALEDESYVFEPGMYFLRGSGGRDVGAFEASLRMPEFLQWTNRDSTRQVDRTAGIEVTWSGCGPRDQIIVQGFTARMAGDSIDSMDFDVASFVCTALPGSTSFTIPASVLESIPPTTNYGAESGGVLVVAAFSGEESTARFSAPLTAGGEIAGDFGYLLWSSKLLPYR